MNDSTDLDLPLKRLRSGDRAALGELFGRFRPQLLRMVQLRLDPRLGQRVSASDVLQEAYLAALSRVEAFFQREGMSFYVWLRLVVNQSLVDLHRRHILTQRRGADQEAQPIAWAGASSVSLARHLIAQQHSPSQVARSQETIAQVQLALDQLEPMDREILTLRHFEELNNSEVAELLGLQKSAASNRYIRALGRLREALIAIPGFFDEDGETMAPRSAGE